MESFTDGWGIKSHRLTHGLTLEAAEAKIAELEANPPSNDEGNENTGDTTGTTDSGCGATVALGGVAMLALAGAMMLRKKED